MAAITAKLLIAMNDSSRRPRSPYPGPIASAEVTVDMAFCLLGPLVPPRPSILEVCSVRAQTVVAGLGRPHNTGKAQVRHFVGDAAPALRPARHAGAAIDHELGFHLDDSMRAPRR